MKKTLLVTIISFILIIIGLVILILAFFKPSNHNLDIQNKSSYEVTYNDNNYFSNNLTSGQFLKKELSNLFY